MTAWKQCLQRALLSPADERGARLYSLATLSGDPVPRPHVRTVVHRGFVNENTDGSLVDSPCGESLNLLVVTDVRTEKATEIGSTRDAPVELAWWLPGAQLQFRIQGIASVLPHDTHKWYAAFPAARLAPPDAADVAAFWRAERLRMWEGLREPLRASFFGPAPGTVLAQGGADAAQAHDAAQPVTGGARGEPVNASPRTLPAAAYAADAMDAPRERPTCTGGAGTPTRCAAAAQY
ncbi:tRNA-dihydrouridine(20) synthase [NAD(P)(+)] [Malassezia sp. CBS 17886]|nr:tRNA-dihydrouridine(20) synthase [NAD(P)(+)] [Malassezia sp. CBS 17886]